MERKRVYVDMDNVLVDFGSAIPQLDNAVTEEFENRLDEVPGIFGLMSPMPGALDAYAELVDRFDTYVLSTAPWLNPSAWSDKLLWIQKHLGTHAYKRLILTHNKHLNHGHFLIDDRVNNGAGSFEGELILFGSERFRDWSAVMTYLREK